MLISNFGYSRETAEEAGHLHSIIKTEEHFTHWQEYEIENWKFKIK